MGLFYDDQKQYKTIFRQMWRTIFADPLPYEKFYFQNIYDKNQVLAFEKDHEIAGMLHLNPYTLQVNEHRLLLHYIVGVATTEKYRRQGIMRQMLIRSMQDMAKAGEVFTYLMPADVNYYEPFDFAVIQSFQEQQVDGKPGLSGISVLEEKEYDMTLAFVNDYCSNHFSVFTTFDHAYLEQLRAEVQCEQGEILIWKRQDAILGFCCYDQDEEMIYIRQLFCEKMDEMIEELCMYFSGKSLKITCDGQEDGSGALIMARILCLERLMPMIRGRENADFYIHIDDPILEHQNGNFHMIIKPEGCCIEKTIVTASQSISIRDLTKIIFGFQCQKLLEQYPDFQLLNPLHPVMIGEII